MKYPAMNFATMKFAAINLGPLKLDALDFRSALKSVSLGAGLILLVTGIALAQTPPPPPAPAPVPPTTVPTPESGPQREMPGWRGPGQDRMGEGRMGEGRMGEGRMGQGRMGEGRMGEGRMGEGRMGEGRMGEGRMGEEGGDNGSWSDHWGYGDREYPRGRRGSREMRREAARACYDKLKDERLTVIERREKMRDCIRDSRTEFRTRREVQRALREKTIDARKSCFDETKDKKLTVDERRDEMGICLVAKVPEVAKPMACRAEAETKKLERGTPPFREFMRQCTTAP